jgi:hypothetical protein
MKALHLEMRMRKLLQQRRLFELLTRESTVTERNRCGCERLQPGICVG